MTNKISKKVLFIVYLFPPAGGGGVQRSSKFVKYLPEFGWQPLVLTVKEPYDFYSDDTLIKDLDDDVKVYRTFSIEPMRWVRKILKKGSQKKNEQKKESRHTHKKSLKPGFLVKLKTYILIPDNEILWLPFAVFKGMRIIKKERPSIIYSTASPYTDHLIALILTKLSGLPWAADFRDPWVDRANFPRNRWRLFIDRKLEKLVLKSADNLITVTSLIAERFKELHPHGKFTVITNGYDENDFIDIQKLKPPEQEFRITYTGIFNEQRNPGKVFQAFRELIDERDDFKDKVNIRIIGQLDNPGNFQNINFFRELKLDKYSNLIEYQPHHQVIAEMQQATVLLLLIGDYHLSEAIMTGKIFEYLRADRPILAIVPPEGVAAEVIQNTNSGVVVSNKSIEDIKEGISQLFEMYLEGKLESRFKSSGIDQYSRERLSKKLADVFNNMISI